MSYRGRGRGKERGSGRGGRGGSRRGGGGRGGGRDVKLSKYLSFLLRHGAEEVGLDLRSDGFARLDDVLALKKSKQQNYTEEEIRAIVDNENGANSKKRFTLRQEGTIWVIRANQGHSDKRVTDLELTPITSTAQLPHGFALHGTDKKAWKLIKNSGLSKMNRNHIHMAVGEFNDAEVQSGVRQSATVLIYLDIDAIIADNIPLLYSSNKVVLSPGKGDTGVIPPNYFLAVVDSRTGEPFDPDYPNPAPQSTQKQNS